MNKIAPLLVFAITLAFLVLFAYAFASAERKTVIGECFEQAHSIEQASACRMLRRTPSIFPR